MMVGIIGSGNQTLAEACSTHPTHNTLNIIIIASYNDAIPPNIPPPSPPADIGSAFI